MCCVALQMFAYIGNMSSLFFEVQLTDIGHILRIQRVFLDSVLLRELALRRS